MEYKIFKQRSATVPNFEFIKMITEQFGLSALSASFLIKKGFTTIGQIEEYLFPKAEYLHNPLFFKDMQKAVDRIRSAVSTDQKIVIYGDYDCDGVCASAILYKALRSSGAKKVECYLPDRFSDGYGMNPQSVKKIIDAGAQLIITVDNGITAVKEIELAAASHVDVILTDHHNCPSDLPGAFAVINPKIIDETYPYPEICGASVALKLAMALGIDHHELRELISLAAIATVADLVPLTGENRTITSLGLRYMKENCNLGVRYLAEIASLRLNDITCGNVAFQIAPRINAAGRLYSADLAFELMITEDIKKAKILADQLNKANNERKEIEETIVCKAEKIVEEQNLLCGQSVLFIRLEDENEGVIGIAAGRLCEKYNRPVIIACTKEGICKASARSIPAFDLYDALSQGNEYYIKFGGHAQAAGFSIIEENFIPLSTTVNAYAEKINIKSLFYKRSYYDIEAASSLITEKAVREIELFAPFGIRNPHPVYKLENVSLRNLSKIGSTKEHLRCNVLHKSCNFIAVGFYKGSLADEPEILEGRFDLLFTPSINTFNKKSSIQLEIKDIDLHYECSHDYYVSLYEHFMYNYSMPDGFDPSDKIAVSIETVFESFDDTIFIAYGKDSLTRLTRYASFKGAGISYHYGNINKFDHGRVNILVNPLKAGFTLFDMPVIVLDRPSFFDYEKRLYANNTRVRFLKNDKYLPDILIDRDFIAFIYKKLRVLQTLGQDIVKFIAYLNSESEREINYFNLRIGLDIMSEIGILDYEIFEEKIHIEFHKISEQKDINQSEIMIKLTRVFT